MTDGWTCTRCGSANVEASLLCSTCGLTRPDDERAATSRPASEAASSTAEIAAAGAPSEAPPTTDAPVPGRVAPPGAVGWVSGSSEPPPGGTEPPPTTEVPVPGWVAPAGAADGVPGGAPPPPVPLWRRIPLGWLIVAVIVVGAAITGWYFSASRSSTGEITKQGDLTAADLRVGDCFDLKDPAADEINDVTAIPCGKEHEFELFFVGSLPEGAYPAEDAFKAYVTTNCFPAFGTFVGKTYEDSELDIYWLIPTDDAWRAGDREVQCSAFHPRIHRLTQSLKGSNQ